MKLLHTADLHLGRIFFGRHLTPDQEFLLDQVVTIAEQHQVDACLIAGDVYDRGVPPTEAIELLDRFLIKLVIERGIQVIVIAGNHDSPERIGFGSSILSSGGLHMRGTLAEGLQPVSLRDEHGELLVYPIPFCEPSRVRFLSGDESIKTHDDAMKYWMKNINDNRPTGIRSVVMTHAFMVGGSPTEDSERPLSIGGAEFVETSHFVGIDYVALGHLHRPQQVRSESIQYAGSLMPYSFSESTHKKSVTLVEFGKDGLNRVERFPLELRRQVKIVKGELEDLLKTKGSDDYIMAELTDTRALLNPFARLKEVYPNLMHLVQPHFLRGLEDNIYINPHDLSRKSDLELYGDFFNYVTGRDCPTESKEWLASIIEELRKEEIQQ